MISTSPPSRFTLSSSYARVTPSIRADLEIMNNLCQYYRQLFDISDEEVEHEKTCVETLLSVRNNQCQPRKLSGTMVSVYFESRADELNGYAINILEQETTATNVIDKLLKQIHKHDCFFWALFEVIIDQNLERPMFSAENISDVLHRYRTCLPSELNRQATFVVKLNYVQFEKERLQQQHPDLSSIECEYFDLTSKRWIACLWVYEKATVRFVCQDEGLLSSVRLFCFAASSASSLEREISSMEIAFHQFIDTDQSVSQRVRFQLHNEFIGFTICADLFLVDEWNLSLHRCRSSLCQSVRYERISYLDTSPSWSEQWHDVWHRLSFLWSSSDVHLVLGISASQWSRSMDTTSLTYHSGWCQLSAVAKLPYTRIDAHTHQKEVRTD